MLRIVVSLAVAVFVSAQAPGTAQPPLVPPVLQVQYEEAMSRMYLGAMLKMQQGHYEAASGSLYTQIWMLEQNEKGKSSRVASWESSFNPATNLEEEDATTLFGENKGDKASDPVTEDKQVKMDLMASYYLNYAVKLRLLKTLFAAADMQKEFWSDRAMQLYIQHGGQQLPPQLLQLVYMKSYHTQLATLKLSTELQMISHWTTWLEDAIDVNSALASKNIYSQVVAEDQADDLLTDKTWAFSSFNTLSMIDLQMFYIDSYLEAALAPPQPTQAQPAQAQPAQGDASFLEEGASTEFVPLAAGANPLMMTKMMKFYLVLTRAQAAQQALMSVHMESEAYRMEIDDDVSNDAKAEEYRKNAQALFGFFGMSLGHAGQIQQWMGVFELYSTMQPGAFAF